MTTIKKADTRKSTSLIKKYIREKFGVSPKVSTEKFSMGDALRISYIGGPDEKIIDTWASCHLEEGNFNGMEDIYEYKSRDEYGLIVDGYQVETRKYVTVSRSLPVAFEFKLAKMFSNAVNYQDLPKIETVEDYKSQWGRELFENWQTWSFQNFFLQKFRGKLNFCTDDIESIEIVAYNKPTELNEWKESFTYTYKGEQYNTLKWELPRHQAARPATAKTAAERTKTTTAGKIFIIDYSDRAFAVIGDTYPHRQELGRNGLGGKFNKWLRYEGAKVPGWIFSNKKREDVERFVNSLQTPELEETPQEEQTPEALPPEHREEIKNIVEEAKENIRRIDDTLKNGQWNEGYRENEKRAKEMYQANIEKYQPALFEDAEIVEESPALPPPDDDDDNTPELETYEVRNTPHGRVQESIVKIGPHHWQIHTGKGSSGNISTSATRGAAEDSNGFKSFSFMMFTDPSFTLIKEKAKATEKKIKEQHLAALRKFKKIYEAGELPETFDQAKKMKYII